MAVEKDPEPRIFTKITKFFDLEDVTGGYSRFEMFMRCPFLKFYLNKTKTPEKKWLLLLILITFFLTPSI